MYNTYFIVCLYVCLNVLYSYPDEMERFVWQLFDVIALDEDLQ